MVARRVHKPIWGFGPVGWFALVLGGALIIPLANDASNHRLTQMVFDSLGPGETFGILQQLIAFSRTLVYHIAQGALLMAAVAVGWRIANRRVGTVRWLLVGASCIAWPLVVGLVLAERPDVIARNAWSFNARHEIREMLLLAVLPAVGMVVLTRMCTTTSVFLWAAGLVCAAWPLAVGWLTTAHVGEYFWTGWGLSRGDPSYWYQLTSVAPTACFAAAMLHIGIRFRRQSRGSFCEACGYSRTGLAQNVTCPECGETPAATPTPSPPPAPPPRGPAP